MKLERLGSFTSELSASLIKSIVVPPGGLLNWLNRHPLVAWTRERQKQQRPDLRSDDSPEVALAAFPGGPVVLIGGYPAPDEAVVEAVHLAGGRSKRVAVVPVAAAVDPAAAGAEAIRIFTRFGMKRMELLELNSREQATRAEWCKQLASYDAVVLCGESAAQGLRVLQATLASVTLRDMVEAGKLLVGIEGAASLFGSRLLPSHEATQVTSGLGILPGLLIEPTFTPEGAQERLVRALAQDDSTQVMGIGMEVGAALVITGGEAKVLGETHVTFLDPRESGEGGQGPKVQALTDGYRMNLRLRRLIPPQSAMAARGS